MIPQFPNFIHRFLDWMHPKKEKDASSRPPDAAVDPLKGVDAPKQIAEVQSATTPQSSTSINAERSISMTPSSSTDNVQADASTTDKVAEYVQSSTSQTEAAKVAPSSPFTYIPMAAPYIPPTAPKIESTGSTSSSPLSLTVSSASPSTSAISEPKASREKEGLSVTGTASIEPVNSKELSTIHSKVRRTGVSQATVDDVFSEINHYLKRKKYDFQLKPQTVGAGAISSMGSSSHKGVNLWFYYISAIRAPWDLILAHMEKNFEPWNLGNYIIFVQPQPVPGRPWTKILPPAFDDRSTLEAYREAQKKYNFEIMNVVCSLDNEFHLSQLFSAEIGKELKKIIGSINQKRKEDQKNNQ